MKYKHTISDGVLTWDGLAIGNLLTNEPLTWDELKAIVITNSRFAAGRQLSNRTREELLADLSAYISDHNKKLQSSDEATKNNLLVLVASLQDKIAIQNREINELRRAINETA